jgi:uncharacterized membrane protein
VRALAAAVNLAYPFAIYLGLQVASPRSVAVLVVVVGAARVALRARQASWRLLPSAAPAGLLVLAAVGVAALLDDARGLKLAPVVVNLGLLAAFGRSLLRGPSLVEVLARLRYGSLPAGAVAYCRCVTAVWCVFFALNAIFIAWLAVAAPLEAWTLYTGLIAYLLVGALLALESVVRARRFRQPAGGVVQIVLRRILPPRSIG